MQEVLLYKYPLELLCNYSQGMRHLQGIWFLLKMLVIKLVNIVTRSLYLYLLGEVNLSKLGIFAELGLVPLVDHND